jgi:hypothetical protein
MIQALSFDMRRPAISFVLERNVGEDCCIKDPSRILFRFVTVHTVRVTYFELQTLLEDTWETQSGCH